MAANLDKSLEDIMAEKKVTAPLATGGPAKRGISRHVLALSLPQTSRGGGRGGRRGMLPVLSLACIRSMHVLRV
jgi:hypothetical protein